jgi:serine/threonine protein phosphatase 1
MKFFVTSDIHSYLAPLKKALDAASFDPNNEEHWLISCGDLFDRGPDSLELLHYIMSIDRKVLVKGNHDILLDACCQRGYPQAYDKTNGTFKTIIDIGGFNGRNFDESCQTTWNKTARYRELLVNYFETENYIFVHSWIPTSPREVEHEAAQWIPLKTDEYMEDWRNANSVEWEESMWGNPFRLAMQGLNNTGKTIVFGHWHCSAGYCMNDTNSIFSEFGENACWEPYKNDQQQIIGLDRCTAYTGEVNVLVIEDTFIDKENKEGI